LKDLNEYFPSIRTPSEIYPFEKDIKISVHHCKNHRPSVLLWYTLRVLRIRREFCLCFALLTIFGCFHCSFCCSVPWPLAPLFWPVCPRARTKIWGHGEGFGANGRKLYSGMVEHSGLFGCGWFYSCGSLVFHYLYMYVCPAKYIQDSHFVFIAFLCLIWLAALCSPD